MRGPETGSVPLTENTRPFFLQDPKLGAWGTLCWSGEARTPAPHSKMHNCFQSLFSCASLSPGRKAVRSLPSHLPAAHAPSHPYPVRRLLSGPSPKSPYPDRTAGGLGLCFPTWEMNPASCWLPGRWTQLSLLGTVDICHGWRPTVVVKTSRHVLGPEDGYASPDSAPPGGSACDLPNLRGSQFTFSHLGPPSFHGPAVPPS